MKSSFTTLLIVPFLSLLTEMASSDENGQKPLRFLCAMIMLLSLLYPLFGWIQNDTVQNELRDLLLASENLFETKQPCRTESEKDRIRDEMAAAITDTAARQLSETLTKEIREKYGLPDANVIVTLQQDETLSVSAAEAALWNPEQSEAAYAAAGYLETILGCSCPVRSDAS